jgi:hypothetical protein
MWTRSRLSALLLAISVIGAEPPAAASSWTIPGIVNASGLNNTHFVSDVAITNPGTLPTRATLSFFPSSSPARTVTLGAGETVVTRDVAGGQFGLSGTAGALSISSDQPLLLRARTYNTAASGTYGVALPVYEDERLLTPGETGDSLWISQDASGATGSRTNVAVVFPNEDGGEAVVTVYDADGNERGTTTFSLDVAGFQQLSVGAFAGAVPVGRARLHVTRGRAASYAVVVDNVTGDSSLFTFEDLPGGRQDVLVNGVARANGRNGTFFRTDARFYNPTDTDATVTVALHAAGNANPAPATASFTLPAGKIREVADVLDALLGLPVGSSGALRFTSDWPVAILCRTSNVDPFGVKPGTFGSQQKPVPLLSFLSSADAGAVVAGIRQNATFRTNIGFAAGPDGARYTLTLTTAAGATVASASGALGANGWTQPNVQDLFPSVTIPPDAAVLVKVGDGSLDVYDSSIDNASGDPVLTPARVSPLEIPASATIGPQGGSIRSDDGRLTLRIPAGALTSAAAMAIETLESNDAPHGKGPAYVISPAGLSLGRAATLVLRYDSTDLDGSSSGSLGLAFKSSGRWYVLGAGSVDAAARSLLVPVTTTAPAASAAPSARRALAETSPVTSYRADLLAPVRRGLLPGAAGDFVVLTVGPASSSPRIAPVVPPPPLVQPISGNFSYSWYVNDRFRGDETQGKISNEVGPRAQYKAPPCPPAMNPVDLSVQIGRPRGEQIYSNTVHSKVRILAKKWTLSATVTYQLICPNDFLFAIRNDFSATRPLVLDETYLLKEDRSVSIPDPKTTPGEPKSCNPSKVKVERGIGPAASLGLTVDPSPYDENDDVVRLGCVLNVPDLGFVTVTPNPGGPYIVHFGAFDDTAGAVLRAGESSTFHGGGSIGEYSWQIRLKPVPDAGCR